MNIHYNTIQQDYLCCDVHEMTFLYGSKMIDLYLTLMWQTLRYLYQFQSPEHLQFPWLNLQAKKIMNKKYIRITIANNGEFIERERESTQAKFPLGTFQYLSGYEEPFLSMLTRGAPSTVCSLYSPEEPSKLSSSTSSLRFPNLSNTLPRLPTEEVKFITMHQCTSYNCILVINIFMDLYFMSILHFHFITQFHSIISFGIIEGI